MGNDIYLGIDVGGTRIKWGAVDGAGDILRMGTLETRADQGAGRFLTALESVIGDMPEAAGVGICTAGIVDSRQGKILGGIENIPFLKGLELRRILTERTGRPIEVINDVNAAALGEGWVGAGRGCGAFFCVTIGTGIGGSLMLDGKLYDGSNFHAGEIGYMRYRGGGSCLETDYSAKALLCAAKNALGADISPDGLFDRVAAGEERAARVYGAWVQGLGGALADTLLMLDPEKLIIGGGITERGALLLEPLAAAVREGLPPEMGGHYAIELARCGNRAGILGAVRNYLLHSEGAPEAGPLTT